MQNKKTFNTKGERHGYWDSSTTNGHFYFKCHYVNGIQLGCYEHVYISDSGKIQYEYYAR
jgi:hypothetical protein